ncbi:hypothetical protein CIW69_16440 [Enterobacter cloacae]|nr:hypothetical protein CIW69_16440 [Enterobacter cloacae]
MLSVKYTNILLLLITAFSSYSAQASVTLGSTRIIYHEKEDSVSLEVSSHDKTPYLLQSWVAASAAPQSKEDNTAQNVPFIVTPPLFKISNGENNEINIIKTAEHLPEDRESVFYLNVKAIPGKIDGSENTLLIAVKNTLKIIYRPDALADDGVEKAWGKLSFTQHPGTLEISNPSPYYITFYSLTADGSKIDTRMHSMISPFDKQTYALPHHTAHHIAWRVIGDLAQISDEKSKTLP